MTRLLIIAALCLAVHAQATGARAADPKVAEGKQLFVKVGCYQCHGYVGQGGREGLRLAPEPLPYDALAQFVRGTTGAMPAYSTTILSDADLGKIYAYLSSIPKPLSVDKLPLLKALP